MNNIDASLKVSTSITVQTVVSILISEGDSSYGEESVRRIANVRDLRQF